MDAFPADRSVPLDALLAERAWTERLARGLVADPAAADDLVQQAWLHFLRRPPSRVEALRAWLRTVLKNEARQAHRGATRRAAREAVAAPPLEGRSPDEIVERVEAQRRVAAAVMDLEEPYRSTVLLAFWDGLAPSEIAARTGVPVETVRTRTKRALARLRGRLDAERGGDGTSWGLALLPVAGWARAEVVAALRAVPGAAGTSALVGGTVVMAHTKQSVVVVALLALLAGVAGTLGVQAVVRPAQSPSAPTSAGDDAASTETRTARIDGTASRREGRAARPSETLTAPAARTEPRDPVDSAVAGSVCGRIALADGTPVAGVTVRATVRRAEDDWTWRQGEAPPDPAAATVRIRAATERARIEEESSRWTVTDAAGEYRFADIGKDEVWIRCWKEGTSFQRPDRGGMSNARAGERVDFVATVLAALVADVIAPDGTPLDQATLLIDASGGVWTGGNTLWSRARPHIWTRPGRVRVKARGGPGDVWTSAPVTVDLVAGAFSPRTDLRMKPRLGIRGRVEAPPGYHFEFATLRARRLAEGEAPDDAKLLTSERNVWLGAGRSGEYEFLDLEPGTHHVGLVVAGPAVGWSATVDVADGIAPFDFRLPAPTGDRFLGVRAEAPDGTPLREFSVQVTLRIGRGSSGFGIGGLRADDGTLWFPRQCGRADVDDADECRIMVTSQEYGTSSAVLSSRNRDCVVVRFAVPGSLEVVAPDGTPADLVQALQVSLDRSPREGSWGGFRSRTAADRSWRTGPLEPGDYVVRIAVGDGDGSADDIAKMNVTVGPSALRVVLALPPLRSVTVRTTGVARGTNVQLVPEVVRGGLRRAVADKNGVATFRWVPEGVHRVRIDGRRPASPDDLPRIDASGDVDLTVP